MNTERKPLFNLRIKFVCMIPILVIILIVSILPVTAAMIWLKVKAMEKQHAVGDVLTLKTGERVIVKRVYMTGWTVLYPGGDEADIYPEMLKIPAATLEHGQ